MKLKKYILILIAIISIGINKIPTAKAANGMNDITVNMVMNISNSNLKPGEEFSVTININSASKKIASGDVTLSYDSNNFEYVSYNMPSGYNGGQANNKPGKIIYSYFDSNGGTSAIAGPTFVTFKLKAKTPSSTTNSNITATVDGVADSNGELYNIGNKSTTKNIKIVIPDNNNYLSSIAVTPGTLSPSFNKNTTNYRVELENYIKNITITAKSESDVAIITGIGTKNLNYGENKFNISIKSQSGSTKVYTIVVNVKDNRNKDSSLKDITISKTKFKFDGNKSYNLNVEYNIDEVNVTAVVNNNKSKVSGAGKHKLNVGNNTIALKVTAENGSSTTYTIKINRKEDPNKKKEEPKSNNNKLKSLSLSPLEFKFDKNSNQYDITVPYVNDVVEIKYECEDSKATVKVNGSNQLKIGNNKIVIEVKAENGEIRNYILNIKRKNTRNIADNNKQSIISMANENDLTIFVLIKNNEIPLKLDKEVLNVLKTKQKKLVYEWYENDKLIKTLEINSENLDVNKEINPTITNEIVNENLKSNVKTNNPIYINITNSNIPMGSIYKLNVPDKLKQYELIYDENGTIEKLDLTNYDGKVEVKFKTAQEYIIAEKEISIGSLANDTEQVTDNKWIIVAVIIYSLLGFVITKIIKNIKTKKA